MLVHADPDALAELESLLAAAPVGIAFFDRALRFQRINDALATMNGHPTEAHVGRTPGEVIPEMAPVLVPLLRQVLSTGDPIVELEVSTPDTGAPSRWFLSSFFPVRIAGDAIVGVGAMIVEITARKRMEDELRDAVRAREDVLAIVSHDLRTPVATTQITASLLIQELRDVPRVRKHLEVLQRSLARLQHLVDDLVDSVNIRAGRLSLELSRHAAELVMTEAVELQEPIAVERGIAIQRICSLQGATVQCDRHRILQVFGNLLANALKFCRPGDTIVVSGERDTKHVTFSIHDNGPGIAGDVLGTLFEVYRPRDRQRHAGAGSGLGLHICKGIIERHGGRIWIESQPARGTTVYFTLPVAGSASPST